MRWSFWIVPSAPWKCASASSSPSGHMSPYLSSQKQLLWPLLRSRSKKKKCKKKKLPPSGCGRATQASAPNHPLPRQHSSRQQLQQINLPLTVHLDWINLELGAITAIGRRGYSPNAGCYPALGIKKRSQLFFFFSPSFFFCRIDWIRCFSVLIAGLREGGIGFSV